MGVLIRLLSNSAYPRLHIFTMMMSQARYATQKHLTFSPNQKNFYLCSESYKKIYFYLVEKVARHEMPVSDEHKFNNLRGKIEQAWQVFHSSRQR